ncbi:MAG: ribosome maturation factor RimM [Terriglobales bacterium]|jgi:16S rRNA processing protein RimM
MRAPKDASGGQSDVERVGSEWVTLALVVKTQGRQGEVAAELHTDVEGRFKVGMRLSALLKDGSRREVAVEELWPHKSWLVLKFAGVESITDAEALVKAELQVPRSERAALEPGLIYLSDLIGCTVFDGGREIGPIEDVVFGAGEAPLLVVRSPESKGTKKLPYEIPFAEAYLERVDVAGRQVRMRLPEGLLAVNGPVAKEEKGEGR